MAIDRRKLVLALLASAAATRPALAGQERRFAACRRNAEGDASLAIFSLAGDEMFALDLPARGHDIAARPRSAEFVCFARRPGNWFVAAGAAVTAVHAPAGRHFYGHGVFSPDGRILYATENDIAEQVGMIGLYDATGGYARIGEFASGGIGPHDIALLPRQGLLVVANGGLKTDPISGRETLESSDMQPNLVLLDPSDGSIAGKFELSPEFRRLSIRHLAAAGDDESVFGCQHQGDALELPPLAGRLTADGALAFLETPEDALARMSNYVGSVSYDGSQDFIAAASPHGGQILFWRKRTGSFLGALAMSDACGLAPAGAGRIVASSGNAGVREIAAAEAVNPSAPILRNWIWDNHVAGL